MDNQNSKEGKSEGEPNYRALFVIGICLEAAGAAMLMTVVPMGIALIGCGVCLMSIGLAHRDKWHTAPAEGKGNRAAPDTQAGAPDSIETASRDHH